MQTSPNVLRTGIKPLLVRDRIFIFGYRSRFRFDQIVLRVDPLALPVARLGAGSSLLPSRMTLVL